MAEASDFIPSPGWRWVLLGDYLEQAVETYSRPLAEQLIRGKLDARQLEYSYFDADGRLRRNDLPESYWLEAEINTAESSAKAAVPRYPRCAEFVRSIVAKTHPKLPSASPAAIPFIYAYKVAVLVPCEKASISESESPGSAAQTEVSTGESTSVAPAAVETKTRHKRSSVKEPRVLEILGDLDKQRKLRRDWPPADVEKMVLPKYRRRWPDEAPKLDKFGKPKPAVSRDVMSQAYLKYIKLHPAK